MSEPHERPWATLGTMDSGLKEAVKEAREAAGITQEEAAFEARMSSTARWCDMERPLGRAKPVSLEEILRIAKVCKTEPAALVRRAMEIQAAGK